MPTQNLWHFFLHSEIRIQEQVGQVAVSCTCCTLHLLRTPGQELVRSQVPSVLASVTARMQSPALLLLLLGLLVSGPLVSAGYWGRIRLEISCPAPCLHRCLPAEMVKQRVGTVSQAPQESPCGIICVKAEKVGR